MVAVAEITRKSPILEDLPRLTAEAHRAVASLYGQAKARIGAKVTAERKLSAHLIDREQHAVHGLAWLATYEAGLRELSAYANRLTEGQKFGEMERLLVQIAAGEYLAQVVGGIPMNQAEFARLSELGLTRTDLAVLDRPPVQVLLTAGNSPAARARLVELMIAAKGAATFGDCGLDDTLDEMRSSMRRFVEDKVSPHAHQWHLENAYVPMEIVEELAGLGVFALTLPEQYGGMGLGKVAMCVVSEELSRGWIAVGSLGTRAEIAGELILGGGSQAQKDAWLPRIASGEILPTAVFTEPATGSDLGSRKTRAVRDGDVYKITGNKTWITHPVRADIMTLLARTDPQEPGYKGLSMFIAEKPRGNDADPFPIKGMSG